MRARVGALGQLLPQDQRRLARQQIVAPWPVAVVDGLPAVRHGKTIFVAGRYLANARTADVNGTVLRPIRELQDGRARATVEISFRPPQALTTAPFSLSKP